MNIIFINIKQLVQIRDPAITRIDGASMRSLPTIENAFLRISNGLIEDFGHMKDCPKLPNYQVVDASGRIILPSWCDSHTHLVYAGNREGEFVDRINGLSYAAIAKKGGGILNSAKLLQQTSEEDLYHQSAERLDDLIRLGTGAIEIKSGYGLTMEAEIKMLNVIKRLKTNYDIPIKATFLAAHALPQSFQSNKQAFIELMTKEVLPVIVNEKLAEYIDVFCEEGYFSAEETDYILSIGKSHGLIPKIHVNQFNAIGGVQVGVKHDALSVDHLEIMRSVDIETLKDSDTMPVALPGCSLFLGIPYTPARKMIDSGLPLALATDYNPGSSPSGNMNLVISLACIKMKITPEEAINAATINGAYAMGLSQKVGSITKGKFANLILTKEIESYCSLPYNFGSNLIGEVYLRGKKV